MKSCTHCQQGACASCGGTGCGGCGGKASPIILSRPQAQLLARFAQVPFLPLCRLAGPDEEGLPFFLPADGDETIMGNVSSLLQSLNTLGLISLDYDLPLEGYDYTEYSTSSLPAPILERGSMALTPLGIAVLEQVEGLL